MGSPDTKLEFELFDYDAVGPKETSEEFLGRYTKDDEKLRICIVLELTSFLYIRLSMFHFLFILTQMGSENFFRVTPKGDYESLQSKFRNFSGGRFN
jgi:hypothetical protein